MQLQNYKTNPKLSSEFSYLQKILAFNSNKSIEYDQILDLHQTLFQIKIFLNQSIFKNQIAIF